VYANDVFELQLGTDPKLTHLPALPNVSVDRPESTDPIGTDSELVDTGRGGYRGVYAWALMPSGKYIIEWMTIADINKIRDTFGNKVSQGGKPLPWTTSWGEMARKTVIRRLAKRLPAAAVDKLLAVDAAHDEASQVKISEVKDELADVRRMALAAVGRLPALAAQTQETVDAEPEPSQTPPSEAFLTDAAAAEDEAPTAKSLEPQPNAAAATVSDGPDPDVAAAMRLAAEQDARKTRDDLGRYRR